jgi:fucose 4-O-acetylase-like acetyltransferase
MDARAETIATPDNEAKASVKSNAWCRVRSFVGTPYLPVAALALVAVAASAVWFTMGGSWWFPLCVAVSALSMIAVWWCVYKGWIQRKAIHGSFCSKKETPRESQT